MNEVQAKGGDYKIANDVVALLSSFTNNLPNKKHLDDYNRVIYLFSEICDELKDKPAGRYYITDRAILLTFRLLINKIRAPEELLLRIANILKKR